MWSNDRILREAIVTIGTKTKLLTKLPDLPTLLEFNCLPLHHDATEKNWFGYTNDKNKHIIANPAYGKFFPLEQGILDFNINEAINVPNSWKLPKVKELFTNFASTKIYKCEKISSITGDDLIGDVNKEYREFLVKPNGNLFRFSGGSWGVPYEKDIVLFVGHVVSYLELLDYKKCLDYIQNNPTTQKTKNLTHLLASRTYELGNVAEKKQMRYFQILFTINYKTNKVEKISHAFNIFKSVELDTSVNFPIGLVNINNTFLISFGESDYNACIVSLQRSEIDKLLTNVTPSTFQVLTYDNNKKRISYEINLNTSGGRKSRKQRKQRNRKNRSYKK
jgi:hypothetical protein